MLIFESRVTPLLTCSSVCKPYFQHRFLCSDADIWWCDYEQHTLLGYFLGSSLYSRSYVGLFFRSAGHPNCLHRHGSLHKFSHHIPSLDMLCGIPALPIFPRVGLCPRFCIWVVIGI